MENLPSWSNIKGYATAAYRASNPALTASGGFGFQDPQEKGTQLGTGIANQNRSDSVSKAIADAQKKQAQQQALKAKVDFYYNDMAGLIDTATAKAKEIAGGQFGTAQRRREAEMSSQFGRAGLVGGNAEAARDVFAADMATRLNQAMQGIDVGGLRAKVGARQFAIGAGRSDLQRQEDIKMAQDLAEQQSWESIMESLGSMFGNIIPGADEAQQAAGIIAGGGSTGALSGEYTKLTGAKGEYNPYEYDVGTSIYTG